MIAIPKPWRWPLLCLAAAWALLAALYWSTGASMVEIWNRSDTFAHAWVVPPIAAWLVWRQRAELASMVPQPAPVWLLLLLPLGLLWLMGDLAAANAAKQFALLGMAVTLVPALIGTAAAGRIAFPLGFLFFAVPFGDFMTPWLMERTADFTVSALRLSGVPVFREALEFVIPTGSWSVVQACSGIRYLMASVMVGTLFAYLNYASNRKRWVFVGVAIVTPLVANWLRAYMIVMLGHLSGNKLAVGVDHIIYGWVFFGIIMLAMFMIGSRWSDPDPEPVLDSPSAADRVVLTGRHAAALAAALLLLAVPMLWRGQIEAGVAHGEPRLAAPALPGWTWSDEPLTDWPPQFPNAAATLHGRFQPDGADRRPVGLFIGYYRDQTQGRQLITSVNGLVSGAEDAKWSASAAGQGDVDGVTWRTAELRGQALASASAVSTAPRLRVSYLYWINGRPFASEWQAKLYGAWQRLLGHGDDAAIVVVYADKAVLGPDDARLQDFIRQHWAALDASLRGVRDGAVTGTRQQSSESKITGTEK